MKTAYDPFYREEEIEQERLEAGRAEHEEWSREQAFKGNAADRRENAGVWIKRHDALPDDPELRS
jgi:hypothetical protein